LAVGQRDGSFLIAGTTSIYIEKPVPHRLLLIWQRDQCDPRLCRFPQSEIMRAVGQICLKNLSAKLESFISADMKGLGTPTELSWMFMPDKHVERQNFQC